MAAILSWPECVNHVLIATDDFNEKNTLGMYSKASENC